jgi:threonine dehydratase
MIGFQQIQEAHAALAGRLHRTPLLSARLLGERAGCNLWIKAENLQKTGSFKVRGALNRVRQLDAAAKRRGLVTVSAGNHAQALAYAARAEGVQCTVVMPEHASPSKVAASEGYGATVELHGDVFAAFDKMQALHDEKGYEIVHPFDDEAVMAGQGTVGIEIIADLDEEADVVVVPIGGGGLISGVATAIRARRPEARVIGVEPTGAAAVQRALDAGSVVRLESIDTIADGLSAPMTSDRVLEHVRASVDDIVLVSDADIVDAMTAMLERCKLLVEPAGAAALAAVLSGAVDVEPDQHVVVIASGGNIGLPRLHEILG